MADPKPFNDKMKWTTPIGIGPIFKPDGTLKYVYPRAGIDAMRYDKEASIAFQAGDMDEYERLNELQDAALEEAEKEWRKIKRNPDWVTQPGDPSITIDMTEAGYVNTG